VLTIQASIDVLRQEVDEYYGSDGFWCECYAWNSASSSDVSHHSAPRSAKSRRAVIQAACECSTFTMWCHDCDRPIHYDNSQTSHNNCV